MIGSRLTTPRCERTRAYVSLDLDRELSEFERVFMTSHLAGCRTCRSYRSELHAIAVLLRTAAAEIPEQKRFSFPARPTRLPRVRLGAAASFAVALLGTASLVAPSVQSQRGSDQQEHPSTPALTQPDLVPALSGARSLTLRGGGFNLIL